MSSLLHLGKDLLLALCCQGEAQVPQTPPVQKPAAPAAAPATQPATLHQAWLAEVLDLDTKRAATLFAEVAQRTAPGSLDRWVAAARLAELRRLGIPGVGPIDLAEAPREIREVAAALPPLDVKALILRVSVDPEALYQSLGTEAGKLPPLRQIVPAAEMWLLDQIDPTLSDRSRQRRADSANRAGIMDRIVANRILEAELEERRPQADGLRNFHFPGWQPPAVSADHKVNLERFQTNLVELQNERQLRGSQSRELLKRLEATVKKAAAADPAAATALLLRLPHYAERLLKETSLQGR